MIINTGMRTDIPAFYHEWLINRIKEGFVLVRNPYNPSQVTRYSLAPEVVDLIAFCTKNPAPMLRYMDVLKPYGQYWFVTITPYGKDIEPNVPDKQKVMEDFKKLSDIVSVDSVGWRYDPIFVDDKHNVDWHINQFEQMAATLSGYTKTCVISFIDIYKKVERNFPDARAIVFDDAGYFYFVRAERDDDFGRATLIETSGGGVEAGEDLDSAIKDRTGYMMVCSLFFFFVLSETNMSHSSV